MQHYSSPRKLLVIWLLLMVLTVTTMFVGKVTNILPVGMLWMGVLMAVTWFKASLILGHYLELKTAKGNWNKALNTLVGMIVVIMFCIYAGHEIYLW